MEYKNKMVLIIDDSYLIIERVTEMLQESESIGDIMHALSATEATEIIDSRTPDIVLLDINLPDTNGVELLRTIKDKYPGIVVIMLTNQANDYYRQLCLKLGADYFADKSKDFELLPDIITSLAV